MAAVIAFAALACDTTRTAPFERARWDLARVEGNWVAREAMGRHLVEARSLIGLSRASLTMMLGEPERYSPQEPGRAFYLVREDYGSDIDPVLVDHLVVTLGPDDVVRDAAIERYAGGTISILQNTAAISRRVELAHAAERAQRDRSFALDAVARAR
jgi:hypothetical protein